MLNLDYGCIVPMDKYVNTWMLRLHDALEALPFQTSNDNMCVRAKTNARTALRDSASSIFYLEKPTTRTKDGNISIVVIPIRH